MATSIVTALSGLLAFYFLVLIPLCVFIIIAQWKVFRKAGEPGWKCLIPGYNMYILYKIAKLKKPLLHTIVVGVLTIVISTVISTVMTVSMVSSGVPSSTGDYMDWFWKIYSAELLSLIPVFVLTTIVYIKLAKAFGKSAGFGIGLLFLSFIFLPILGFGPAEYIYKEEPIVTKLGIGLEE